MANHASALKRAKQSEVKRLRNKAYKTRAKKAVREVRRAVADNDTEQAKNSFVEAVSTIQKTASKGVIHKNKASRKVSRLARQLNQMGS